MTISKEVLPSLTLGSPSAEGSQTLTLAGGNIPAEGVTPILVGANRMRILEMPTAGIHMQGSHPSREHLTPGPLTTEETHHLQRYIALLHEAMVPSCPVSRDGNSCLWGPLGEISCCPLHMQTLVEQSSAAQSECCVYFCRGLLWATCPGTSGPAAATLGNRLA